MNRLVLALLLATGSNVAAAAPSGSLAYLSGLTPWLETSVGTRPRLLPHQGDVYQLAVSPVTGDVAYLEASRGRSGPELPAMRGMRLAPPYSKPRPLPATWNGVRPAWLRWSDDGWTLHSANWNGRPLVWTVPGARTGPGPTASTSRDGRVVARSTDTGVAYTVGSTGERAVFTPARPQPLLEALREQRHRPGVDAFLRSYDPAVARDPAGWAWSVPAVSPDGQAVYFAANLGQGDEDMRNNYDMFVYRLNTRDGKLLVLGKYGRRYGERPILRVSPDGKRLLLVESTYISAVERPVSVVALDLATQAARDLTSTDVGRATLNVLKGFCWLADGRHVAYSVRYFRREDVLAWDGGAGDPGHYTLYVKDAVSGRTVRTIPGATQPGCGPA